MAVLDTLVLYVIFSVQYNDGGCFLLSVVYKTEVLTLCVS